MGEHKPKYLWAFPFLIMLIICTIWFGMSWVYNQPRFSDDWNAVTTTSIVSSYAYSVWTSQTTVLLNNGLRLYYYGNIELLIGGNYTITYRQDSLRILSLKLSDGD